MKKCKSLAPVINSESKILILGSMPGVESLEKGQYYAHKNNRFWKVMGLLCNRAGLEELSYEEKIKILLKNNFALFDVIKSCSRIGSLDTNIKNEEINDIKKLLKNYKNIKIICLNGTKAYNTFKKYYSELFNDYVCLKMLSTSPANAKYKLQDLYEIWKKIL